MSHTPIPLIDLGRWHDGDQSVVTQVDAALRESGFLLVGGHGVDPAVIERARHESYRFFRQPIEVKESVGVVGSYRGWVGPGTESNAASYGVQTLPDLKESFVVGPPVAGDDPYYRSGRRWFAPNKFPTEQPELEKAIVAYVEAVSAVADDLLELFAVALGLGRTHLLDLCRRTTATFDVNWYPSHRVTPAEDAANQYRVGPHTDFGTFTILDREPGMGGLQVQLADDEWIDAPFVPGAFTVNVGDLMTHWTNGRWRSTRHRVLPPPPDAPDEELVSLIYFHETDYDAVIEALPTCVGPGWPEPPAPVIGGHYVADKIDRLAV